MVMEKESGFLNRVDILFVYSGTMYSCIIGGLVIVDFRTSWTSMNGVVSSGVSAM